MTKPKSPPGHQETTLLGLKAEWVALAQRCTAMDKRLTDGLDENKGCTTGAVVLAIAALGLTLANCTYIVVKEWL